MPVLPSVWSKGSVSGLKAVGNHTVGLSWEAGELKNATIRAGVSEMCTIRTKVPIRIFGGSGDAVMKSDNGYFVYSFATKKGKNYKVEVVSK